MCLDEASTQAWSGGQKKMVIFFEALREELHTSRYQTFVILSITKGTTVNEAEHGLKQIKRISTDILLLMRMIEENPCLSFSSALSVFQKICGYSRPFAPFAFPRSLRLLVAAHGPHVEEQHHGREGNEVGQQVRVVVAYRDDDFVVGDDADGDGAEGIVPFALVLDGDAENGEQPVAFGVGAGTLVGIGDVGQKRFRHLQCLSQEVEVVVGGAHHTYPAVGHPFRFLYKAGFTIQVCSHSVASFVVFMRAEALGACSPPSALVADCDMHSHR